MAWNEPRCSVRLVASADRAREIASEAIADDARPTFIDLAQFASEDALLDGLTEAFEIPYPMGGVDGALDWLSDLSWLPVSFGHLVVFDNLDTAAADVAEIVSRIVPFSLDRWRGCIPAKPYAIVLVCDRTRVTVQEHLNESNARQAVYGLGDGYRTRPVPVIIEDVPIPTPSPPPRTTYVCPVCGFPGLDEPARHGASGSYEICPSCGFEFGYHDDDGGFSDVAWRRDWIEHGMRWRSEVDAPPADWDPPAQLELLVDEPVCRRTLEYLDEYRAGRCDVPTLQGQLQMMYPLFERRPDDRQRDAVERAAEEIECIRTTRRIAEQPAAVRRVVEGLEAFLRREST